MERRSHIDSITFTHNNKETYGIMLTNNKNSEEIRKADLLSRLHDVACAVCGLFAARYLLMSILAFGNALQDVDMYSSLGSAESLWYYLSEYSFLDRVVYFLCVSAELVVYIAVCHRTKSKKAWNCGVMYFFIMLALHEILWLHAHLFIPGFLPQFAPLDESAYYYRQYAAYSILPAITYFILYLLRVRKLKQS